MTKKLLSFFAVLSMFCGTAIAEFFSVSAGIPISYAPAKEDLGFSDSSGIDKVETDGMPSGTLFHVKFPILVGIGLEQYSQDMKLKSTSGSSNKVKLKTEMYDLFYLLPLPILNVTFGIGTGTAELECEDCDSSFTGANESATMFQHYIQVGFPIGGIIDLHVAWHQTQTATEGKLFDQKYSPNGEVYSLGIQIGL